MDPISATATRSRILIMKNNKIQVGGNHYRDMKIQPVDYICLLYTSPSPRDRTRSRMPSSA